MPCVFFDRIIKACDLGDCRHNWDAIFDFLRTETPVDMLYITGEGRVDPQLQSYNAKLHDMFDKLNQECITLYGIPFTVVLS